MRFWLRIADNVLADEDYGFFEVTTKGGVVTHLVEHNSLYSTPELVGKTLEDVLEWLKYDGTGRHPEEYHEVFLEGGWTSRVKGIEELIRRRGLGALYKGGEDGRNG